MSVTSINIPKAKESSTTIEGTHHVYHTLKSNGDSQNFDFIIRNGLAGGAAGCAVSLTTLATNGRLLMRGYCRSKLSSPHWKGSRFSSKPLIPILCNIPPTGMVYSRLPETCKSLTVYLRFSKVTRQPWSASSPMLVSIFSHMNRSEQ
jgi:hypothetical protein